MKLVIYGLTITSSWGNGHATTYRSLTKALHARGHQVLFIEKDVEWYRNNRDLPDPDFCKVRLYEDWAAAERSLVLEASDADAVIVGSYFPDAIRATEALLTAGVRRLMFYDIDTPITMAALRSSGRCEYLEASMIRHYSAYLSFTGGPTLQELETRFRAPRVVPFYCSVDSSVYKRTAPQAKYRCTMSYLGTYAADRQARLMELLNGAAAVRRAEQFIVAGPMYPDSLEWSPNVYRITHLAPPEHPAFYSSARWTLNLTRADMVQAGYSPSVRLFEASACASPIVSDTWPGIESFFKPGEEILLPSSSDELLEILANVSDRERVRIGERARERVLAEHTAAHRALEFESIVSES